MKALMIKLTSMGDVIHTLPALTDASRSIPDIQFDFVVEESFQEIPAWHSAVDRVIPVATRRWRKNMLACRGQIKAALSELKAQKYDVIIDAQGLLKSTLIAACAKGVRHGYDAQSIREPLASRFYHQAHSVSQSLHAITRIRQLSAQALAYSNPVDGITTAPDYGLAVADIAAESLDTAIVDGRPYIVFLHSTSWLAKEWPTENWRALAETLASSYRVLLPWGSAVEEQRAKEIAGNISGVEVLPRQSLSALAHILASAAGVVAVDTGLGHLSAALNKPTVSIYGPTDTQLIGTMGENQSHLCAMERPNWRAIKKNEPFDYGKVSVEKVYEQLLHLCADAKPTA